MADYLTQAVLENALGVRFVLQHTDDDKDGAVDAAVLATLISVAESDINIRLNKGYVLPVTVLAHGQRAYDSVTWLCIRAFSYHAHMRRMTVTESVANDYEMVLKQAENMAKGALALPGDPPVPRSSPEAPSGSSRQLEGTTPKPVNRSWSRDDSGNM